jgi:hypothetical protein
MQVNRCFFTIILTCRKERKKKPFAGVLFLAIFKSRLFELLAGLSVGENKQTPKEANADKVLGHA